MSETKASATDLLKQAILLYDDGNKEQARFILQVACQMEPKNESLWLWRAGASETVEEAIRYIDMVIGINPSNVTAQKWRRKFIENNVSSSISALKGVGEPGVSPEPPDSRALLNADKNSAETKRLVGEAIERAVEGLH